MKIVITGGAGYIGSHTAIELIQQLDSDIISIDNFINSTPDSLSNIEKICGKKIKNYDVDIRDLEAVKKVFSENPDIDGIIHFAALKAVGESVENPFLYYDINVNGLLNLIQAAIDYKVKKFIFSSSCSVYGNVESLPVDENTALSKAESPYAHTKQVGEEVLRLVAQNQELQVVALRYFNPVGAHISGLNGENPINKPNNLVPVITQFASGWIKEMNVWGSDYNTRDGSCIRDYVHVSDIADAHLKALLYLTEHRNTENFEIFNLGTGMGISVFEAIQAFEKVSHTKLNYNIAPRRAGDVESIYSNSAKAYNKLGWKPSFTIDDMMATAWKWQQALNENKKL